jgi:hypothetical protein
MHPAPKTVQNSIEVRRSYQKEWIRQRRKDPDFRAQELERERKYEATVRKPSRLCREKVMG